ncbi:uncharacterized protein LOC134678600 isoform X1 [Cydia fagiglandana]|uniref:uncharacterized protein LOC134678600 isoform X1 n=2 Tax=Cydia fagiglandana TaxID=1458189 RepID=UPI002FEE418C
MCAFGKGFYYCVLLLCTVECMMARECRARCSRTLAPVCALVAVGAARDLRLYTNDCHLNKIRCILNNYLKVTVKRLPGYVCGVEKPVAVTGGRRFIDHTIVGSRNFCNHTCPTHCTDIYEPVCAMIWDQNVKNRGTHVLVNHCHADLLSCSLQLTVQIQTIDYCLGAMTQFAYNAMSQAAAMKQLGLITV